MNFTFKQLLATTFLVVLSINGINYLYVAGCVKN